MANDKQRRFCLTKTREGGWVTGINTEREEMGYWTSKVLPKIKKVFEKNGAKKAAAAEACKSFDDSKEEINKDLEEKKTELQPKVLEIYEASSIEIKTLVKDRTDSGVKKHSVAVTKFLEELVKIEFPGSKPASEASSTFGPALVSGPVLYVFEKVSTFIPIEETPAPAAAEPAPAEESTSKEKEMVVEEEKEKEVEVEKVESTPPPADEPAPAETPAPPAGEAPEPAKPAEAEEPPKP